MVPTGLRFARIAVSVLIQSVLSVRHLVPVSPPHPDDFNASVALFNGFHLVADLGYVSWYPMSSSPNKSRAFVGDVDLEEMRYGLGADSDWHLPKAEPRQLEDIDRLRRSLPRMLTFGARVKGGYYYQLPLAMPSLAAPFAAAQRFNFSSIDFVIGVSLLHTLATGEFGGKAYTVQKFGRAVLIRRFLSSPDFVNLKDKGLQFKRLVTRRLMNDVGLNETTVEHLHVLRVGKYNVLFVGEVDAVDAQGRRVEVKTRRDPDWRLVMFQMIAKGASAFVHGHVGDSKRSKLYLNQIDDYELSDIIQWSTTPGERSRLSDNIIESLGEIRARVFETPAEHSLFHMNETSWYRSERPDMPWSHIPKLHRVEEQNRSLLPIASVLHALFPAVRQES